MTKKGFTITEIIVAIIIIAILALIAIPGIGKILESGRAKYNKNLEKELIIIAKNYYADNKSELPRGQLNEEGYPVYTTTVTVKELEEKNYITNEVVDANKGSCEESYVYVENTSGGYEYYPCLACENYQSENAYCSFEGEGIGEGANPTCEINYENYTPGTWTNKDVKATIIGRHEKGIAFFMLNKRIKIGAENNEGKYTIKESMAMVVEAYSRTGNKGECEGGTQIDKTTGEEDENTKILIEKTSPECESVEITPIGWQRSKEARITATDSESGIKRITYEGEEISLTGEEKRKTGTVPIGRNGNHNVIVEDKAGNKKTCTFTVTGIDITPPEVELTGGRTISGGTTTLIITANATDNESGIEHYEIYYKLTTASTYTKETKITEAGSVSVSIPATTGEVYNYYVEVYDKVGNKRKTESKNISGCGEWEEWSTTACTVQSDICESKSQYQTRGIGTTNYSCPYGGYLAPANKTCASSVVSLSNCICNYTLGGCPANAPYALGGNKSPDGQICQYGVCCKTRTVTCASYSYNCTGVGGCGEAVLNGTNCYYYGSSKGAYCSSGYTLEGTTCYGSWGEWMDGTCPDGTSCQTRTVYRHREGC